MPIHCYNKRIAQHSLYFGARHCNHKQMAPLPMNLIDGGMEIISAGPIRGNGGESPPPLDTAVIVLTVHITKPLAS